MMPGPYVVEVDSIVHLGSGPGPHYGVECAACQYVSGIRYDSAGDAEDALEQHRDDDHTEPR